MATTSTPTNFGTKIPFHTWDVESTLRHFATDREDGLTKVDAAGRLEKYGTNELVGQCGVSKWKVFVAQLSNSMTVVLLLAFLISMAIRDWVEAGVIMIVVITNTVIGFFQEYRAEKTMESLRNLTCPTALVIREGAQHHIPALQVVPGDIIQFKDGDVIPADLRLLEVFNLEIDEALLTGESAPAAKTTDALGKENVGVGDRVNLAYSSTIVTKGRGKGIVINTGMTTEIGRIAKALSRTEGSEKTLLQRRVDQLALRLLLFAVFLAIIVFTVNRWDISSEVALYAISVAIAVIPEGLVAVMTITMGVSVRTMAKQKAIVRKLSALEAIGQVSNICSDKTGTITQGRMVLSKIHLSGIGNFSVTGEGYNPTGEILRSIASSGMPRTLGVPRPPVDSQPVSRENYPEQLRSLARVAALCNQAVLRKGSHLPATTVVDMRSSEKASEITAVSGETSHTSVPLDKAELPEKGCDKEAPDGGWKAFGDPTECAIQVFATKIGMGKPALIIDYDLIAEFPFESAIKRASVIVRHKATREVYVLLKGATEQVMRKCNRVNETAVLGEMESLAAEGLRVLAFAERKVHEDVTDDQLRLWKREDAETGMALLGLVGIFDPPRPQSKGAIQACARAGISVHMLTGDHPKTAAAIALSVGLISRAEAKATSSAGMPAPASPGGGIELFRSITMAAEEQPTANMVMTAEEFDALTDREIDKLTHLPKVIARCAPHTKTRMIAALHRREKVVAMTGDGVNDAPSLKAADVGTAMGLAGSDVAKQASDIVLTNDNFATISKAVFEGRRIFDNIQKFILHLMSTNVAEVILLVIGLAFMAQNGDELVSIYPMSPVQILWLNMATSSPPAMGLGFEKAASHLQEVPPRPKSKGLFGRELLADIFVYGALMGLLGLANWSLVIYAFGDGVLHVSCNKAPEPAVYARDDDYIPGGQLCNTVFRARATVFLSLIFIVFLHAINCRHARRLGFVGVFRNKFLLWSIIIGSVISIFTVYIPGADLVFKHAPIYYTEWGVVIVSNIVFIALSALYKLLKRAILKPLGRPEEEEEVWELEKDDEDDSYGEREIQRVCNAF